MKMTFLELLTQIRTGRENESELMELLFECPEIMKTDLSPDEIKQLRSNQAAMLNILDRLIMEYA